MKRIDKFFTGEHWNMIKEMYPDLGAQEPDATVGHPNITRVEVIDDTGRAYVMYGCKDVKISYQDGGRTLKVFLSSDK